MLQCPELGVHWFYLSFSLWCRSHIMRRFHLSGACRSIGISSGSAASSAFVRSRHAATSTTDSTQSTDGGAHPSTVTKRVVAKPRRKAPIEDDDLLSDVDALLDDDAGGATSSGHHRAAFIQPLVMRHMTTAEESRMREKDEDDIDEGASHVSDGQTPSDSGVPSTNRRDPLMDGGEESSSGGDGDARHPSIFHDSESSIEAYTAMYSASLDPELNRCVSMPIELVVEHVTAYMRASINPRVVSAREEAMLFPVLLDRMSEMNADMLLDIVEQHWARSTLVRHGTLFKDAARDRIAAQAGDLTPAQVLRTILVMGMSAGRRKCDLDFFQVFGRLFNAYVNEYKDPNDLVRVLTAFSRAKIVPPPSFLAMIGRRLPVLCKTTPLEPLPCYRVLVNLFRMGYDHMNIYRFLADRIFDYMDEKIKAEKKRIRVALRKKEHAAAAAAAAEVQSTPTTSSDDTKDVNVDQQQKLQPQETTASTSSKHVAKGIPDAGVFQSWLEGSSAAAAGDGQLTSTMAFSNELVTQRFFQHVTGLRPVHFTKLLLVLARFGAPHQQYLRPLIDPVITPVVPHLNPPTFARLIRVVSTFRTTDVAVVTPIIQRLIDSGAHKVLVQDVFEMLRIMASPDVPVPPNFTQFVALCAELFSDFARLRAADMCTVASDLMRIQMKEDIDLDTVEPLGVLLDSFAERLTFLMELGVLSLTHAEVFVELCEKMHHPDRNGKVALLKARRREINQQDGDDDDEGGRVAGRDEDDLPAISGDEKYYAQLDVDVRETFHKVQIVNNWNTYGNFRPLPGVLQVDFRKALAAVSADCLLETAHLYDQAYPGKLTLPVRRLLSRALQAKFDAEGEEIIRDDNTIEMRKNAEMLFTRSALKKFANMLHVTPLERVKKDARIWTMVKVKAEKLRMPDIVERANDHLSAIVSKHTVDSSSSSSAAAV